MSAAERTVIGVVERLELPDWGVDHLRVKIDTGARTSALHVDEVEEIEGDRARFWVVLDRRQPEKRVMVEAPIVRRGRVRSSSGRAQKRLFVRTRMVLGGVDKEIEISLASREPMIFRMLLGRSGLERDFLVDPSSRYLQSASKPPPKAKKKTAPRRKTSKRKTREKTAAKDSEPTLSVDAPVAVAESADVTEPAVVWRTARPKRKDRAETPERPETKRRGRARRTKRAHAAAGSGS